MSTPTPPTQPIQQNAWKAAFVGRWVVLALLAGHLLLRQTFAHLNFTSLIQLATDHHLPTEGSPRPTWVPGFFDRLYLTEVCLVLLLPLAFYVWNYARAHPNEATPGQEDASRRLGLPFLPALAFLLWGASHALAAVLLPSGTLPDLPPGFAAHPIPDWYLVFRQSALSGYALFFMYTFLFFRNFWRFTTVAAVVAVAVAIACAVLDWRGYLGEWNIQGTLFGQETLALAMLAMFVVFANFNALPLRAAALLVIAFVGWRQTFRFQSGVPISIAGALLLYLFVGVLVLQRGQSRTLKRAAACLILLAAMAIGYKALRSTTSTTSAEVASKVSSWSPQIYRDLLKIYDTTTGPADPANPMISRRPPYVAMTDPEVYKLQAVYVATPSVNSADIVWRIFVWRKKAADWFHGRPLIGAGVGQPWFYEALYHTNYHYGEEREGLDPHNSFLNLLYRYGLIGLALVLATMFLVVAYSVKALRRRIQGDALLEGLLLYFFFSATFAFFNNALEGPSYALPFWISLGLVYARAWQVTNMSAPEKSS